MDSFQKGRKKDNPCKITLNIEPDGGHSDETPIFVTLKASIEDLKRLKDMADYDPEGLGLAVALAMSRAGIIDALDPSKKEPATREIKRNARWLYATLQELKSRDIPFPRWPKEIQDALQNLLSKGLERAQIDPVKDPENFTFCIIQEAYYEYAKSTGLTVFREDETSSSFSNRYLFDNSSITPSKIRSAFLKGKSPTEMVRLAHLEKLFSRLQ